MTIATKNRNHQKYRIVIIDKTTLELLVTRSFVSLQSLPLLLVRLPLLLQSHCSMCCKVIAYHDLFGDSNLVFVLMEIMILYLCSQSCCYDLVCIHDLIRICVYDFVCVRVHLCFCDPTHVRVCDLVHLFVCDFVHLFVCDHVCI